MKIIFLLISLANAQNVPTYANLLFPVNGINHISNCGTLQNLNKDFITEHQYFCSNMISEYVSNYCVNLTNMPDDCFKNIGDKINTLYTKKNQICSKINTIFNNTNSTIMNTINTFCNEKLDNSFGIALLITIGAIFGFCVFGAFCSAICSFMCYKYDIYYYDRKRRLTIFRSVAY
jgi:hypothetical protein